MAAATINARHRKHYKSGSCLDQHPLGSAPFNGRRFRILLQAAAAEGKRQQLIDEAKGTLQRIAERYREAPPEQSRSTQSIFGKVKSKILGLFGRKAA